MNIRAMAALAALVLGGGGVAHAEVIDFTGSGLNRAVSISVRTTTGSLLTKTVAAGELNWRWLGTAPEGFANDIYTYCVDAAQFLQDYQTVTVTTTGSLALDTASYRPAASANAGAKVAWLFNTYAAAVHTSGSNIGAAALQIAIWEALYDSSASLGTGTFRLNTSTTGYADIANRATGYLNNLYSSSYSGSTATWLNTQAGQDQITHGVPEPSTLLLLAVGALSLRRRVRQTA